MSETNWRVHPRPNPRGGEWEAVIIAGPEAGGVVICEANLVAAEQIVQQAADVAKLREALSPRSASWSQRALDVAPLLLGLCASASADDRGAIRVRNGTKPPQTPITDSQEGAIEVFLEEGPAAMVALMAERAELQAECAKHGPAGAPPDGDPIDGVREILADLAQVRAERDELRLEIAAMRGQAEGRISDRWTWRDDRWELDAPNCAASVDVRLTAWIKGTGGATVPVDSIRAGMRQCESWSAGGAS